VSSSTRTARTFPSGFSCAGEPAYDRLDSGVDLRLQSGLKNAFPTSMRRIKKRSSAGGELFKRGRPGERVVGYEGWAEQLCHAAFGDQEGTLARAGDCQVRVGKNDRWRELIPCAKIEQQRATVIPATAAPPSRSGMTA
jgi:hypothetical protein